MHYFDLDNNTIKSVVEKMGGVIECWSPLDVSLEESFASRRFAEIVIQDLILDACNRVLNYEVDQWHKKEASNSLIYNYIGLSEADYFRWVDHSHNLNKNQVNRLISKYLEEPEKFNADY